MPTKPKTKRRLYVGTDFHAWALKSESGKLWPVSRHRKDLPTVKFRHTVVRVKLIEVKP